MSSKVIIDPSGDILLQLHKKQPNKDTPDEKAKDTEPEVQELIVSSKVLSLVSPVFKAMISGLFKEGIELAQKKESSETFTLCLPEDNAEATTILCKITHFDLSEAPERPNSEGLEELAFLCDKYQCTSALKYCGSLWLRDWLLVYENEDPLIDDLCRLLVFAYVIDCPHEFLGLSWRLCLNIRGPLLGPRTESVVLMDHPLLHHDIARELDAKRFQYCKLFHEGMMAPLNKPWITLTDGCYRASKVVGNYIAHLRQKTLLSYDLEFTEHRFRDLIKNASSLPYITISDYRCPAYDCVCKKESTYNLSSSLLAGVGLIQRKCKTFICLDCLKTDKRSKNESKCRILHY